MVKGEAEKAEIDMLLEKLNASRADEGPDRWHWRPGPSFVAHTINPSSRAFSLAASRARAKNSARVIGPFCRS